MPRAVRRTTVLQLVTPTSGCAATPCSATCAGRRPRTTRSRSGSWSPRTRPRTGGCSAISPARAISGPAASTTLAPTSGSATSSPTRGRPGSAAHAHCISRPPASSAGRCSGSSTCPGRSALDASSPLAGRAPPRSGCRYRTRSAPPTMAPGPSGWSTARPRSRRVSRRRPTPSSRPTPPPSPASSPARSRPRLPPHSAGLASMAMRPCTSRCGASGSPTSTSCMASWSTRSCPMVGAKCVHTSALYASLSVPAKT